jgi:putative holliday junction resolvase
MARALALDLGTKRIGVASSDLTRTLASPVSVVLRHGTRAEDHRAIGRIIDEYEPDVIVVGLPVGLDGREGKAAELIRQEVDELRAAFAVPVVVHDERFTTASAHRALAEQNVRAKDRRHVVDKVAAAVLLQTWLDGEAVAAGRAIGQATTVRDGEDVVVAAPVDRRADSSLRSRRGGRR